MRTRPRLDAGAFACVRGGDAPRPGAGVSGSSALRQAPASRTAAGTVQQAAAASPRLAKIEALAAAELRQARAACAVAVPEPLLAHLCWDLDLPGQRGVDDQAS